MLLERKKGKGNWTMIKKKRGGFDPRVSSEGTILDAGGTGVITIGVE